MCFDGIIVIRCKVPNVVSASRWLLGPFFFFLSVLSPTSFSFFLLAAAYSFLPDNRIHRGLVPDIQRGEGREEV